MTQVKHEENRARNLMLSSLMGVDHRDYAKTVAQLQMAMMADPDLIARFCVHLLTGGTEIRDQQDAAVIALLQASAEFPEYRVAGRLLMGGWGVYDIAEPYAGMRGLPPYRLLRVAKYIDASDTKVPRLLKRIMTDYIRSLEAGKVENFDRILLLNRNAIRWAYKRFHVRPNERAQAILFDDNPPVDSMFAAIKEIAKAKSAAKKARLIVKHKIPYRIASSLIPKMTPAAGISLIDAMSPTEALNSRAWVERSGILTNAEVKKLYLGKVSQAQASLASADHRVSAQGADEEVQAVVDAAKQTAVDKMERIEGNVLLMVDKSGSMDEAIETAILFGVRIAPLCDGDLMVVAHDTYGRILEVDGDRGMLETWKGVFRGIRAGGGTNYQRGFEVALEAGFMPDKLVLLADGGENSGDLAHAIQLYPQPLHTVMIHLNGQPDVLSQRIEGLGIEYDKFEYSGDYYLFDQIIAMLGGPRAKSLVERVLEVQLPKEA